MKNEKMIKGAKKIDKLLKVLHVTAIIGIVMIGIYIILLSLPNGLGITSETIELEFLNLNINENVVDSASLRIADLFAFIPSLILLIFALYSIKLIKKIIEPMKSGLPFENGISLKIRKYGFIVLISGFLRSLCEFIETILINKAINYDNLFNMANVSINKINFDFDLSFLFIVLSIFLLSYVFQYGEELQKESDETL